jgi:hypothetical protein
LLQRITPAPPKPAWKRWTPTAAPVVDGERAPCSGEGGLGSNDRTHESESESAKSAATGEGEQELPQPGGEALATDELTPASSQ